MYKKTKDYEKGQALELTMIKGTKGNRPIAYTDEGIICLIDSSAKGFYEYGSTWLCEIKKILEKVIIVKPVEMLASVGANKYAAYQKAQKVFGVHSNNTNQE